MVRAGYAGWRQWRLIVSVVAVAACAACTPTDKAGSPVPAQPVPITIATRTHGSGPAAAFAQNLTAKGGGRLTVSLATDAHRDLGAGSDAAILADVAAGRVDLGVVSIAALQAAGVHSFDALVAPGLLATLDAEVMVAAGGLGAEALAGVGRAGVTGIALVPGPIHRLVLVGPPISDVNELVGKPFRVVGTSTLATEAVRALHAVPEPDDRGDRLATQVAAFDAAPETIISRSSGDITATFATNIPLWPEPTVIVAYPALFDRLGEGSEEMLLSAGRDSAHSQAESLLNAEMEALGALCFSTSWQVRPLSTSAAAEISSRIATVTERLRSDEMVSPSVDRVRSVVGDLASVTPGCGDAGAGTDPGTDRAVPTALLGGWQAEVTEEAFRKAQPSRLESGEIGPWRMRIGSDRRVEIHDPSNSRIIAKGSFIGDLLRITIIEATQEQGAGEIWQYSWSVLRDNLTLTRRPGPGVQSGPTAFISQPFVRAR